eukprot:TRINITY_DN5624_c0_g1_i2.p1 TRINITY_DN5624_c0_g1~~TRINITY_DN5624_c0_g1_i2.p1  ORF type:complete len:139 (-),score=20.03 TRINITY_DN5624_c0_g1_i2:26-442(-)
MSLLVSCTALRFALRPMISYFSLQSPRFHFVQEFLIQSPAAFQSYCSTTSTYTTKEKSKDKSKEKKTTLIFICKRDSFPFATYNFLLKDNKHPTNRIHLPSTRLRPPSVHGHFHNFEFSFVFFLSLFQLLFVSIRCSP